MRAIGQGLLEWALDLRSRADDERDLRRLQQERDRLIAENAGLRLALQRLAPDAVRYRHEFSKRLFQTNGDMQ